MITLSELMSDVQVTQMKSDGSLEESGEARRLRKSLEEMADESRSIELRKDCGLPGNALEAIPEGSTDDRWSWLEVKHLSDSLIQALDAGLEHALLVSHKTIPISLVSYQKRKGKFFLHGFLVGSYSNAMRPKHCYCKRMLHAIWNKEIDAAYIVGGLGVIHGGVVVRCTNFCMIHGI